MKHTLIVLAAVTGLLFSLPAYAEFMKCVGPDGDVLVVNTECPEGYKIEATREESAHSDEDEPYICTYSSIVAPAEIDSALAEAKDSLQAAENKGDNEKKQYWEKCLGDLRQRKKDLGAFSAEQEQDEQAAKESAVKEQAACSGGKFEYREGAMYYTNPRGVSCQGLRVTCTFNVRKMQRVVGTMGKGKVADRIVAGDQYVAVNTQEVLDFNYSGRIGTGTEKIGDAPIKGRVIDWECRSFD